MGLACVNKCEPREVGVMGSKLAEPREIGTSLVQTFLQIGVSEKENLCCDQCYTQVKSTFAVIV